MTTLVPLQIIAPISIAFNPTNLAADQWFIDTRNNEICLYCMQNKKGR